MKIPTVLGLGVLFLPFALVPLKWAFDSPPPKPVRLFPALSDAKLESMDEDMAITIAGVLVDQTKEIGKQIEDHYMNGSTKTACRNVRAAIFSYNQANAVIVKYPNARAIIDLRARLEDAWTYIEPYAATCG